MITRAKAAPAQSRTTLNLQLDVQGDACGSWDPARGEVSVASGSIVDSSAARDCFLEGQRGLTLGLGVDALKSDLTAGSLEGLITLLGIVRWVYRHNRAHEPEGSKGLTRTGEGERTRSTVLCPRGAGRISKGTRHGGTHSEHNIAICARPTAALARCSGGRNRQHTTQRRAAGSKA
ncbi:hypothetical protein K4749_39245 [Streptomyces sp. TRM72054]|uniref:hypothetical protein n=1 Tax=Streptomyces sp. TRM72054 TaxID=2870562 RepID=UPI001C8CC5A2|nr:hypothetical protein [Streptomyces sp. TRM72054]MBX9399421.1 hypothetical protein [Streptomyces sp. TRM72054]